MDPNEDDTWNLELSDIIFLPDRPDARPANRRSSSCSNLKYKPPSAEQEAPQLRPALRKAASNRNVSVGFDKVETREFERVLEVNPACKGGGPCLGLGWNYNVKKSVDLEAFESSKQANRSSSPFRSFTRKSPKKKKDMVVMSPAEREKMARKMGFSKKEIKQNVEQILRAQRECEQSALPAHMDREAIGKMIDDYINKASSAAPAEVIVQA